MSVRSTGRKLMNKNPALITDGKENISFPSAGAAVAQYLILSLQGMSSILNYMAELPPKKRFLP